MKLSSSPCPRTPSWSPCEGPPVRQPVIIDPSRSPPHSLQAGKTDGKLGSGWKGNQLFSKLGRAGDRFGDRLLCVICANLPYIVGQNQFTNTLFTTPNTQISKSNLQFHPSYEHSGLTSSPLHFRP